MSAGCFITLEGGEGSGKSTQSALLVKKLRNAGLEVVETREPGGSDGAEKIRQLVVTGNPNTWSPVAEALLISAARDDHLRRVIAPAIEDGKFVVCDRFIDSTMAYQGGASGVDTKLLKALETHVVGKFTPNLTLVFDLDPQTGLDRAKARSQGKENRFEAKGLAYHQKIRQAFVEIAQKHAERCVIVDASLGIDDIEDRVWQIVSDRFL